MTSPLARGSVPTETKAEPFSYNRHCLTATGIIATLILRPMWGGLRASLAPFSSY
ncbi:hypothetical protein [Loktanella sp. Alg231-35]|uniref:hypothetical protein n=1 Tax=Loktanella sp. Alg231-35 TaxID=1922220 RepID=UPI00131F0B34|nr:hypothetical protein [Loktanella sp. Alg231-35]